MTEFIMLVGLPGSGKSYVAKHHYPHCTHLSSDAIRGELWGDENDQRDPTIVFNEMKKRTKEALARGESVVYDATNLNSRKRSALVRDIKSKFPNVECHCMLILCSLKECKRRQGQRERQVPDEVIDRMVRQFEVPYYNEGWDRIYLIGNGPKQNIDKEHSRLLSTPHDNPYHSTGSIDSHCTMTFANLQDAINKGNILTVLNKKILLEAAYQHDLGKRKTKTFVNTKGETTEVAHYYGHDNVGAYLWLTGDKRGEWDEIAFLTIGLLIQLHMHPYFTFDKSKDAFVRWCDLRNYEPWVAEWVWLIHKADMEAH